VEQRNRERSSAKPLSTCAWLHGGSPSHVQRTPGSFGHLPLQAAFAVAGRPVTNAVSRHGDIVSMLEQMPQYSTQSAPGSAGVLHC